MTRDISMDEFLGKALSLEAENVKAKKVLEAAKTGNVASDRFYRKPDEVFDERLRTMAREAVFSVWNQHKRDAKLEEIYHIVLEKIADDIEAHEWPKIWNAHPGKRTVDRRVNELAEPNPNFWNDMAFRPCICLTAGWYRPNPALFDESARDAIAQAGETSP